MRKRLGFVVVLVMAITLGCDDDPVSPTERAFVVNLTVKDTTGDPVAGIEAKLHVHIPERLVPSAAKPMAIIPFTLGEDSEISLVVYDQDGEVVNNLWGGERAAGAYQVALAVDGDGNSLLGTRLYRCELVANVAGVEAFRGETFMTLYTGIDSDQRPVMGVTNAEGKIRFNNRVDFPYLYNPGPQLAVDENATSRGTFEFIDKVEITMTQLSTGSRLTREVEIRNGRNAVNLVWDPALATKPRDEAVLSKADPGSNEISLISEKVGVFSIGPGYPNPFN